jgi:hypothetical protein
MHFIYNDPVQCRLHGSIQCGSFQDPRNSRPGIMAQTRFMAFTGHLVPCDYTKDNQRTNHCRSVLAAPELPLLLPFWTTSKPTSTRTMVACIDRLHLQRSHNPTAYFLHCATMLLLPSCFHLYLGEKFSGELGRIMTVCAWI